MFSFVCFVPFLNKIWGRNFKTLRKAYWWGYAVCYEASHKGGWGSNTIFSVTYLLNVPILLLHLSFFNQNGIIIQASFSASCFFNITYEGKMFLRHLKFRGIRICDFECITLREKCPNTKIFLARIFPIWSMSPYSVRIRENTDQKKLCIWTLSTQYQSYEKN